MAPRHMLVAVLAGFMGVSFISAGEDVSKGFLKPPDAARPWVYWFWLDGNITREGITADLEAMRRVGIGGVLIMEVDQGAPKGPARFMSPAWRELFKHAVAEANRLGLEMNMNNDAGWCGGGGPWITTELSMQKLVWTETVVQGPSRFEGLLRQPAAVANFYRDIALLAYPLPAGSLRMADRSPKVSLSTEDKKFNQASFMDGNPRTTVVLPHPGPKQQPFVQINFPEVFTPRHLELKFGNPGRWSIHAALQASQDGKTFKTVQEFDIGRPVWTLNLQEISARSFRILFTRASANVKEIILAEVELNTDFRIADIEGKAAFVPRHLPSVATWPTLSPDLLIPRGRILNLTERMQKNGSFAWDVPEGKWLLLRLGHTSTGVRNAPAPLEGRGLEADKLSKEATEAQFAGLMTRLIDDVKPWVGKTLVSTHIDSWEVGSQNWTPRFREEFQKRRGYDPLPLLPIVTGRVVDSLEVSERFLWDIRQTVSDLLLDYYGDHMAKLAHKHGLRLSIEAYDQTPCDDMAFAGRADEPMCEFWSWGHNTVYSCTEMASAAHVYGKRILGAEAFTASDGEKWLHHPASIKVLGDWAFCEGINRFVFHRYALQPWPNRPPGMSMGPWGLHYERTQTWWEQSRAYHEYLARCQYLLQQGLFVADICYLSPEGSPRRFNPPFPRPGNQPDRPRYNFDGCPPEVVLTRMQVQDGKLILPDGMNYRLLVLPAGQTMTPKLLRKIKDLVEAGATVVGTRPLKSPSMTDFPSCDDTLQKLTQDLWGDCDGKKITEHRCGKGRIVEGMNPEEILTRMDVPPDFECRAGNGGQPFRYIHRRTDNMDIYFVANKTNVAQETLCSFRVTGKQPELWRPLTGQCEQAAIFAEADGCTRLSLHLGPMDAVFVVFRLPSGPKQDQIVSVKCNGRELSSARWAGTRKDLDFNHGKLTDTFTMAVWLQTDADIDLPPESTGGVGLNHKRNDALYPVPGHEVFAEKGHAGAGVSAGRNGVCVYEHGGDYFAPLLVHKTPLSGWTHVGIVYNQGHPSLYLNGKLVHIGKKSQWSVHPGVGVIHGRTVESFRGSLGTWHLAPCSLTEAELVQLMEKTKGEQKLENVLPFQLVRQGKSFYLRTEHGGNYEVLTANGNSRKVQVPELPKPVLVAGPWQVQFTPGWGAPKQVTLDQLISWSQHPDAGVKYYSGTATYRQNLKVPQELLGKDRRLYLDLGRVEVIAEVTINGKTLPTLWMPPFRLDITDVVQAGNNPLEVKVVNLWVNRMIGDENLPEDSNRNPNGTLKEWPKWLGEGQPSPTGRHTFTSWRLWKKDSPLLESGLLGPVTLQTSYQVELHPEFP